MGMNNIFYRFHHLTKNEKYATLPARLRMNGIRTQKADPGTLNYGVWPPPLSMGAASVLTR